ncbi:hypothetical protein GDO78_015587 [Eleutherodactylus coqui]|uniref:Uncharacterized protein n=1 Tax=Eleutherodactylus coqui TaxID=57060 RepID=A0A8J6EDL7_ELECQ|nr:hypothetical protein GDO78_015587 [Eleutherodactylus coqui]
MTKYRSSKMKHTMLGRLGRLWLVSPETTHDWLAELLCTFCG